MADTDEIKAISEDDPRVASLRDHSGDCRNTLGQLSREERDRYRGKVLAIHIETGKIIGSADTPEELQKAVRKSEYRGQDWRLVDGPTGEEPMTVEELKATLGHEN